MAVIHLQRLTIVFSVLSRRLFRCIPALRLLHDNHEWMCQTTDRTIHQTMRSTVCLERDAASIKHSLQILQPYLHHMHFVADYTQQLVDTMREEDVAIAESERLVDILQNLLIIFNAQP